MVYRWALPDLGEGVHEGEVVRWHVSPGESVAMDQVLAEIQTDKALVEIPSPVAGRVLRVLVPEGAVVPVGTVLVEIETESEQAGASAAASEGEAGAVRGTASGEGGRRRALAAPAVRKRARQLGVDIDRVTGSGPGGRVTMADVEAAARSGEPASVGLAGPARGQAPESPAVPGAPEAPGPSGTSGAPGISRAPAPAAAPEAEEERVRLAGLRRVIAERMVHSLHTAAQVTGMDEADVTELVAFRARAAAEAEALGVKLTYLPFIIKAVISGLRAYPYLNASLDDARGEIVLKHRYHIGIAVDTPDGLVVPVIRDADRKSLLELAREIQDLSERARKRTLTVAELQGGTFTLSNIGSFGGTFATPILHHPQVAILATGRIVRRPMFDAEDRVVPRHLMAVSLTFDHRVLDGAYATRFMRHVVERLERPERLVLEL
ncbi:dihydrolipoamide acetyltransferase family protein [Alicyclobacillus macrosporangiidus]|uniref:dihydrolipoamide acetyltransferase family protein n=1 Tax=Alicyclobacillus macrosporangiidus TaxID=392015 RepID=UPI000495562E|nr:dihydrolipoamide acetyltransferase family protein [Alicyclobacillus macrosporangiidus]